jgi:hypothetical protein
MIIDETCQFDFASPKSIHEAINYATPNTKEQIHRSYHLVHLQEISHYWATTTEFANDEDRPLVERKLNEWLAHPKRPKDPDEDPNALCWLANAMLFFIRQESPANEHFGFILDQVLSTANTRYHLTQAVTSTAWYAQRLPPINTAQAWNPILSIPDVSSDPNLDTIKSRIQCTWMLKNENILEAHITEFLLHFLTQAQIELLPLIEWIEACEQENPSVQVMIVRHWQNWLYYKQFTQDELTKLEQEHHPFPIMPNPIAETKNLLSIDHIISITTNLPADAAEEPSI